VLALERRQLALDELVDRGEELVETFALQRHPLNASL
jgi:hypothetical protein